MITICNSSTSILLYLIFHVGVYATHHTLFPYALHTPPPPLIPGWAIDGHGYLRDVPAAEHEGEWPTTVPVVDVYPVQEKGGFVWLFFGRYVVAC